MVSRYVGRLKEMAEETRGEGWIEEIRGGGVKER